MRFGKNFKLSFVDPISVRSKTDGQFFNIYADVEYRRGRKRHINLEALVRRDVLQACERLAVECDADEGRRLADLLNADFGLPKSCADGCYVDLVAWMRVSANAEAIRAAVEIRADRARLARLKILKDSLYADPALFVIMRAEACPELVVDKNLIRQAWDLSVALKASEGWWGPLMSAWSELAGSFSTEESASAALNILVDAIRRMDRRLAEKFGLAGEVK